MATAAESESHTQFVVLLNAEMMPETASDLLTAPSDADPEPSNSGADSELNDLAMPPIFALLASPSGFLSVQSAPQNAVPALPSQVELGPITSTDVAVSTLSPFADAGALGGIAQLDPQQQVSAQQLQAQMKGNLRVPLQLAAQSHSDRNQVAALNDQDATALPLLGADQESSMMPTSARLNAALLPAILMPVNPAETGGGETADTGVVSSSADVRNILTNLSAQAADVSAALRDVAAVAASALTSPSPKALASETMALKSSQSGDGHDALVGLDRGVEVVSILKSTAGSPRAVLPSIAAPGFDADAVASSLFGTVAQAPLQLHGSVAVTAAVAPPSPANFGLETFIFEVGAHMEWMVNQRITRAEIQLNPKETGPIEVVLVIDGEQVRAEFKSGHLAVREALEAGLPQLRESFASQGLQLTQTEVGHRQPQPQHFGNPAHNAQHPENADAVAADEAITRTDSRLEVRVRGRRSLLDEFA